MLYCSVSTVLLFLVILGLKQAQSPQECIEKKMDVRIERHVLAYLIVFVYDLHRPPQVNIPLVPFIVNISIGHRARWYFIIGNNARWFSKDNFNFEELYEERKYRVREEREQFNSKHQNMLTSKMVIYT